MKIFIFILSFFILMSCKSTSSQSLDQGIKGKVIWLAGNMMPGPGQKKEGQPVERELYIYNIINTSEVSRDGQFYQIDSEPVRIVRSNTEGEFTVNLPAGRYSLFSKEENGLFANLLDSKGNVNPIEVKEGEYSEITFKIDYKAVY